MIYRTQHERNFTIVNNKYLNDKELSWKAKGILTYMLSCKDNSEFNYSWLAQMSKDELRSVKAGIRELIDYGYIEIEKIPPHDNVNKFSYVWNVFEDWEDK